MLMETFDGMFLLKTALCVCFQVVLAGYIAMKLEILQLQTSGSVEHDFRVLEESLALAHLVHVTSFGGPNGVDGNRRWTSGRAVLTSCLTSTYSTQISLM